MSLQGPEPGSLARCKQASRSQPQRWPLSYIYLDCGGGAWCLGTAFLYTVELVTCLIHHATLSAEYR